jgi:8-oxo-dGTP pyrophosphatase MutT (NUDIX family)
VLVITARGGKRWTIPKGVVERSMTPAASAAKEAYEEAGVMGAVDGTPIGSYDYEKWGGTCHVEVFPMLVSAVLDDWPEAHGRRRRWLSIEEAADAVSSDDVRRLLREFGARSYGDPGSAPMP